MMVVDQQITREVLGEVMQPGVWYEVKELIALFGETFQGFEQVDLEPIPSEPNRPRWYRIVTNCVRMSPGRVDYPTDNSWVELRTRQPRRNYEYSIAPMDPAEAEIVRNIRDDDGSGYIYAITNDAWEGWVKIGKTIDLQQRLAAHQVYSPYRNFEVIDNIFVDNRHTAEGFAHRLAADRAEVDPSGEWFFIGIVEVVGILAEVNQNI